MKRFLALAGLLAASVIGVQAQDKDIVDTAASLPEFSTLVSLVKEAGLVDTLKGAGPFTVFAPTNAAFAKVPAATLASLKADPEKLKKVLTYHVVSGAVMSTDVKSGAVKTVEGSEAMAKVSGGNVMIDKAKVTKADVKASNGVIHVINAVILPKDL